jgi:hypothetical protein
MISDGLGRPGLRPGIAAEQQGRAGCGKPGQDWCGGWGVMS